MCWRPRSQAAEEVDNTDLLTEIGALAEERQKQIDSLRPEHRLSTGSAGQRGNSTSTMHSLP
jgi:hypothetical protein